MKKLLIVSDLHCGHKTGLTPPDWQYSPATENKALKHIGDIQREVWRFWTMLANRYDALIVNGDAIDGRGEASGGTEQLILDREEQVDMAEAAIRFLNIPSILIIYGTPYHTGKEEDWESVLAKRLGASIGSHEFPIVDGVIFDCKHKVGSSAIPHGRATAINRERLWSNIWSERDMTPAANVIIRSHVHYFGAFQDARGLQMTTPCLQWDTKYGKRQCSGTIDLGAVAFDCNDGHYDYTPMLIDMRFAKVKEVHLA